jgi:hypothetical protein
MVYYEMAQHSDLFLLLREMKDSSLISLFEDIEEAEENIQDCKRIRNQAYFENIPTQEEKQKDSEYE